MLNTTFPRTILALAFVALALWAAPAVARAQTVTGTIQGTVADQNGAALPGASVTIHNVETGQERNVTANGEGAFVATFLPIGKYTVTAFSPLPFRLTRVEQQSANGLRNLRRVLCDGYCLRYTR